MDAESIAGVVVLGVLAALAAAYILYRLLRRPLNLSKMGSWAVVTGATDGIGKAYAMALAKEGLNVALISRSQDKLMAVAAQIQQTHDVCTEVIQADFSDYSEATYMAIQTKLATLEVGVLVNNVGVSYHYPEYLVEVPNKDKLFPSIINCNVGAVTQMTQIVLPGMLARGRGLVVNVSSTVALIPSPLLTVYAASKAYVNKFSRELANEYRRKGIVVQCVTPGYVATKMSKIGRPSWMAPNPTQYVASALRTVGFKENTTGYFPHTLMLYMIKFMNLILPALTVMVITNKMHNIRRRAKQTGYTL